MQMRGKILRLALFVATVATTTLSGGWKYSASLMAILLAHEFGHYVAAAHYGLSPTLPLFFPSVPPFGTFGAFIQLTVRVPNRKALFDVAAAGPLAGLAVAIPLTALGIACTGPMPVNTGELALGTPLLFRFFEWLMRGIPASPQLGMQSVVFAGWVGILITGLNLLPIGQLDGGHVSRAVFGRASHAISLAAIFVLVLFTGMQYFLLLMFLLMFGMRPIPIEDPDTPLGNGRKLLSAALFALFVLCFIPKIFVRIP